VNSAKNVFRQLLQFLPRHDFNLCVRRYRVEHWVKSFITFDQLLCLAYAQISGRESLRDIETCLNSHRHKLYHVGFRGSVSRTTLADANERYDYRIFQDFGHVLIGRELTCEPRSRPSSRSRPAMSMMSGCSMRCRSAKTPSTRWIAAMSTLHGCTHYINRVPSSSFGQKRI
jgi:hypothetical protein